MKKSAKNKGRSQERNDTRPLTLVGYVRQNLQQYVILQGMRALQELLEEERTELCGPAHKKGAVGEAQRWGATEGRLVMGGQRVMVSKPRVRKCGKEVPLPSWEDFAQEDPLEQRAFEQMVVGVSTRNYQRSLDELPAEVGAHGTSRSATSRRFKEKTAEQLDAWLARDLGEVPIVAMLIDGIIIDHHAVIVAMGVTKAGKKEPLGLWSGSTENSTVVQGLLDNLIARNLQVNCRMLFVIDGSKALRKAVKDTFGRRAVVQRCQFHKMQNVLDHLPKRLRASSGAQLRDAYRSRNRETAKRRLLQLMNHLSDEYPDAAASLREGLDETLTLKDLGLPEALERTLSTTNMLENLNGAIRRVTRNVKRWQDGAMIKRWSAAAILEAEKNFRVLRGHKGLTTLCAFLAEGAEQTSLIDEESAAA